MKNALIGLSFSGAFIVFLAAGSSVGSPDFAPGDIPALVALMAGSAAWMGLVAVANKEKRRP